jgi:ArsR family transcriptional regulator
LEKKNLTIEKQAVLFSLLADPTRLKLIKLLLQQRESGALCVNSLAYRLGVTQPAVSQHLKLLKNAGLVKGEKRGYRVHYFIKQESLNKAQKLISQAFQISTGKPEVDNQEKLESEIK